MRHPIINPKVTSHYGKRGIDFHNGTDYISLDNNRDIIASRDGMVIGRGYEATNYRLRYGGGHWLKVRYNFIDNRTFDLEYYHLESRAPIGPGHKVKEGDVIARYGESGYTFGAHLHLVTLFDGRMTDTDLFLNLLEFIDERFLEREHVYKLMYSKLAKENPKPDAVESFRNSFGHWVQVWDRELNNLKKKLGV